MIKGFLLFKFLRLLLGLLRCVKKKSIQVDGPSHL